MFKKFRNALNEVTEEVKANPRFQGLNQLAASTVSSMSPEGTMGDPNGNPGLTSEAFLREDAEFFSLGGGNTSDELLFPSYEPPAALTSPDLDSATEVESSIASEASSSVLSKEHLASLLGRSRAKSAKYKSRYGALANAFKDLRSENAKMATVMQQTQDKALRRISELREQASLSQKAKQHLEEELRGDMEEKEHIIKALETKVALLKSGSGATGGGSIEDEGSDLTGVTGPLVLIDMDEKPQHPAVNEKMGHLEDKVKRLEALLTKCKESITANKVKISALVEVKESLSKQLSEKTSELNGLSTRSEEDLKKLREERDEALRAVQELKDKDQNDELQMAESKLMVHQREIRILEDEMKAKLLSKDGENRLALEENELRIRSLVKAEENKNELLRDLENKLKVHSRDKSSREKELEALAKEVKDLKSSNESKLKELNALILEKDALIRGLEEECRSKKNEDSLERRYYNESLPDMIQSKEDEIHRMREESSKEIAALKEDIDRLIASNSELLSSKAGSDPMMQELELKKTEVSRLESELTKLQTSKTELEGVFSKYKDESQRSKEELRKANVQESLDALTKKDEIIKEISLESSNELEKLRKELHEVKTRGETDLENLKSLHGSSLSKMEGEHAGQLSDIKDKHVQAMEEMEAKISELRDGKNVELLEENGRLQKDLSASEGRVKSLSDELDNTLRQRNQVQKNLEEKLQELDRLHEAAKSAANSKALENDLEKEIVSLRERERSQKDLEAQMIRYQKELQSEIKRMEDSLHEKEGLIQNLGRESEAKALEIKMNAERFDRQISDLKQDLEMKIRLERDREKAHTELKRQSIEYQKKLQEQIGEKEGYLAAAKDEISCFESKIGNLNNLHAREVERLSNRISELTQAVKDLEERRDLDGDITEKTLKECDVLRETLKTKEDELISLQNLSCNACPTLQTEVDVLKKDIMDKEASLRNSKADKDKANTERDGLNNKINELETSNTRLEKKLSDKASELNDLQNELKDKMSSSYHLEETKAANDALNSKLSEIESSNTRLQEEISKKLEENNALQSKVQELQASSSRLEASKAENDALKRQVNELQSSLVRLEEEAAIQISENGSLNSQISEVTSSFQTLQEEKSHMSKESNALKMRFHESAGSQSRLQEELEAKGRENEVLLSEGHQLKSALVEKDTLLRNLREEMDMEAEERFSEAQELYESERKDYVSSIDELSTKVLKLQEEIASHSWGGWDSEPIDLQINGDSELREPLVIPEDSPIATLKISNHQNSHHRHSYACSLEEAAEFEYLKNILYQYMLGKESSTLAKVLATVVKFKPEQIQKIMDHEEQKRSVLASFGLHNS